MKNVTKKFTNDEIRDAFENAGGNCAKAARLIGCPDRSFRSWITKIQNQNWDPETHQEFVKTAQKLQSSQDLNRIKNKGFRETARQVNALIPYFDNLYKSLEKNKLTKLTKQHKVTKGAVGVIHFSDLHFNELVELPQNKYDFTIAGQRLALHVQKAKAHFKALGIKKVLVAFTGDLLNSDRRLDELLSMAYNRALATHLAIDILQQAILDINKDFNVDVAWVNGNEGRIKEEIGSVDRMATDNFDEIIMRGLQSLFYGSKGVNFVESSSLECIVEIADKKLLLVHGHNMGNTATGITKLTAKHALRGDIIDYTIFGHIHEAYISDRFARSGSPVGDNAYSDRKLNLAGRASQNYYIFSKHGIDGVKVDLQNIDGVKGYATKKTMHAYNIKSADKAADNVTIHKIVI